jgi:hypothetical protein
MLHDFTTLLSKEVSILTKSTNCKSTAMEERIYSTVGRGHFYLVGQKITRVVKTTDRESRGELETLLCGGANR